MCAAAAAGPPPLLVVDDGPVVQDSTAAEVRPVSLAVAGDAPIVIELAAARTFADVPAIVQSMALESERVTLERMPATSPPAMRTASALGADSANYVHAKPAASVVAFTANRLRL